MNLENHTTESTPKALSPIAEKLMATIESEIKTDVIARHKINIISPSFPLGHRTMANRDALKIGPKEFQLISGKIYYTKSSLLENLRTYLAKS